MREIKFRGYSPDMKKWIVGYAWFSDTKDRAAIIHRQGNNEMQHTAVIPASVGQFIGIQDKNANDVYAGDIVKVKGTKKVGYYDTEIIWYNTGFGLKENKTYFIDGTMLVPSMLEIIGNAFKIPE